MRQTFRYVNVYRNDKDMLFQFIILRRVNVKVRNNRSRADGDTMVFIAASVNRGFYIFRRQYVPRSTLFRTIVFRICPWRARQRLIPRLVDTEFEFRNSLTPNHLCTNHRKVLIYVNIIIQMSLFYKMKLYVLWIRLDYHIIYFIWIFVLWQKSSPIFFIKSSFDHISHESKNYLITS